MKRPLFSMMWSIVVHRGMMVALVTAFVIGLAGHAVAQAVPDLAGSGASYINPFPPGDIYKLQVYGDGFTDGLLQGLSETMQSEDRIELPRKPRALGALVRTDIEDDLRAEEQSKDIVHIAIVTLGVNDRGSLRSPGSPPVKFATPSWKDQYGQRVDRLLKALKRRGMAVYVVGSPPLRRQDANAEFELVNEVLVERSFANGIRFIEVTESFTDENGAFSQFGPDSAGNREKLRDGDGVGFTTAGYRKLAGLVMSEIKRDLAMARAERALPLAGSEAEQKRINPDKAGSAVVPAVVKGGAGKEVRPASSPAGAQQAGVAVPAAAARVQNDRNDLKAETTRLALRLPGISGREDLMQVDLVRPAISAAVIALLTRKETVESVQQPFELLVDDVGDGLSVSTMVTALVDGTAAGGRRKGASSQAAYSAVWVKGERLPPKAGRADDFSWPRPADVPVIATPVKALPKPSNAIQPSTPQARAAAARKTRMDAAAQTRQN